MRIVSTSRKPAWQDVADLGAEPSTSTILTGGFKMRTLHLTLKKKWFDQIASGIKVIEYREIKPYWIRRLEGRHYDEVHFRNGYHKQAPFMRVEFIKIVTTDQYEIHLGKILEIKNHSRVAQLVEL